MEENDSNHREEHKSSCPDEFDAPQNLDETLEVAKSTTEASMEGPTKASIDYSSDSSESNEKCPICLLSFYDQEIGCPDMCAHAFCASCIEAWAKMMKTCPIDRKSFATINIYQSYENRSFLRSMTVTSSVLGSFGSDLPLMLTADALSVPPPPIILVDVDRPGDKCEICHRADREDVMLLCDECDCGYHIDCLVPALQEIPHGSWYCSNCPQEQEAEMEEFGLARQDGSEEGDSYVEPVRKKSRQVAQITRTKQSELIRKTIMAILSRTKPGGRERRRKRRSRRSRAEPRNANLDFDPSLRLPVRSSQRCASQNDQSQSRGYFRERIPMLNLFGSARELVEIYNDEENDDFSSSFGPAHMGGRPLYASQPEGEVSSQVVCRQIIGFRNRQNILKIKNIIQTPRERPALRVTPTTAPPNLLDSIMESQQIWHSKDGIKDVIVAKGGNISLKRRTIDGQANPPATDGLDTAAGASSNTSSAAVINRNYYQNNNTTNQRVGGTSHYQPQASSSRNFSNLAQLNNASGAGDLKAGGQAALPGKKTLKDMFFDSDEDEEPPKPAKPPARPPRRFSENAPGPEGNVEPALAVTSSYRNKSPPVVADLEPESYTPELRNFDEASDVAAVPKTQTHHVPVILQPEPLVNALKESLLAAYKTSYLKEKSKSRRSKSKEPEKDRKRSVEHKKKSNRRRSGSRSRSKSVRRSSTRRRSRNTRSRSRSKNRSARRKSRERKRRSSRSPVDHKKAAKRRKSRSKTRSKSPARNRSRSRSLNRNNKTWSGRKSAGKRKPRSRSRTRSQSTSRKRDRKVWSWRNRSPSLVRGGKTPPPVAAKESSKKQQPEASPPKIDPILYTQDPVAIIDLTNGVKEIPSEKEVIVVSDSDHENEPALDAVDVPVPEPVAPSTHDEPVCQPSTPPDMDMDVPKTPSPVISAMSSPLESPVAAAPESPIAHTSKATGPLPLPVEIQKLLQSFDTEKLLNNNLLSQINLVSPFKGAPMLSFAPVESVVPAANPTMPVVETAVVPQSLPPVEPPPPASYDSPYSPGSSDFNDLCTDTSYNAMASDTGGSFNTTDPKSDYDGLFGESPNEDSYDGMLEKRLNMHKDDDAIFEEKKARIFSDPRDKDKYLVKLSLQKRASDEAKEQLKPFYSTKQITKQEYKDILRSAVPKICRSREVNPLKIQSLIAAYVKKMHHQRKKK